MAKKTSNNDESRSLEPVDNYGIANPTDDATDNLSPDLAHEHHLMNAPIPMDRLKAFHSELEKLLKETEDEVDESGYNDMTDVQRQRLMGSGIRRLGFIVKTYEIAGDNPQFIPGYMDLTKLGDLIDEITETRNTVITLEQLARIYNDILLVAGNDAFRISLMYYSAVKDAARRGIPGAQAIFRRLEAFFRRGRTTDVEEAKPLTNKETLRKAKQMLEGKLDGEIDITGHARHTAAGGHAVVEDIHRPEAAFKETAEGYICTECHTHNPLHANFCINCGAELKK